MPVTRSILRPVTGGIVGASVGLGGGAAASTLLNDLVSWWSLDEASGSRADSHGSNTLTDSNTVTQATGKVSTAGQFTKVNSEHLTVPATHGLHGGDRDIAIVLWVYLDSDLFGAVRGALPHRMTISYFMSVVPQKDLSGTLRRDQVSTCCIQTISATQR